MSNTHVLWYKDTAPVHDVAYLPLDSGEVKGLALKVISKVQFWGEENQQKDFFILKRPLNDVLKQ